MTTRPLGVVMPQYLQNGTGAVERYLDSRMFEVVSVKDFGAVGDGTTDDSTAIQKALTSL